MDIFYIFLYFFYCKCFYFSSKSEYCVHRLSQRDFCAPTVHKQTKLDADSEIMTIMSNLRLSSSKTGAWMNLHSPSYKQSSCQKYSSVWLWTKQMIQKSFPVYGEGLWPGDPGKCSTKKNWECSVSQVRVHFKLTQQKKNNRRMLSQHYYYFTVFLLCGLMAAGILAVALLFPGSYVP